MRTVVVLCAFCVISWAQESMTPEDIAKLERVSDAILAPNGKTIAYILSVPPIPFVDDDGSAYRHLYVWDQQRGSRPFVTGKQSVSGIEFTANGSSLVFLAKRDGDESTSLYEIPLDGGEAVKLFEHETSISSFHLSPNGDSFAWVALEKGPDRGDLEKKGFKAQVYEEEESFKRLYIWSRGDEKARMIDVEGSVSSVMWRPDGNHLAITVAPSPLIDDDYMFKRLWVIDTSGQVVHKFENPGKLGQYTWNMDGSALAMISAADIHDPKEGVLTIASMADGSLRTLLSDYEGHLADLDWSDPNVILALYDVGTQSTLLSVDPKNGNTKTILGTEGPYFSGFERRGGSVALLGESSKFPTEVFTHELGSKKPPQRVTHHNEFLKDRAFGKQEVVQIKARDGLVFEGILIRPVNEEQGKKYPLIMCVHGGPESHVSNGWLTGYSYPGHMGAARGFAVFYPNYRGSTGRGVAFSKTSQGDPAGKEFDDLVDAVDQLVAMGLVDKDKVGITGGSYGGYATAWATTYYSDRFAAGVMFVGISNKLSKVGTTDIANEEFYVHAMKRVWDNDDTWKFFLERSPVYHAGKSRTPLLIMHGADDPRVHPSQSMEMYRHLKLRGEAPVRLVFYPGEGHGNRRAAARYDYSLRMMRWMEHFLQKGGTEKPPFELSYPNDGTKAEAKVQEAS
ncbi:MAG: S9 family peptidase [Acidobacteria bacterium]|nr:S9 family peptidase [Acidobacteriota bacterium]